MVLFRYNVIQEVNVNVKVVILVIIASNVPPISMDFHRARLANVMKKVLKIPNVMTMENVPVKPTFKIQNVMNVSKITLIFLTAKLVDVTRLDLHHCNVMQQAVNAVVRPVMNLPNVMHVLPTITETKLEIAKVNVLKIHEITQFNFFLCFFF